MGKLKKGKVPLSFLLCKCSETTPPRLWARDLPEALGAHDLTCLSGDRRGALESVGAVGQDTDPTPAPPLPGLCPWAGHSAVASLRTGESSVKVLVRIE